MRASPEDQLGLLDLQEHDSALDRLAHRRRTLPALAVIAEADGRLEQLAREAVEHQTRAGDLARAQRKLEADVDQVRDRTGRDQQRLDAGTIAHPRELETLQSEIASLHRRQGALEDEVLELMEQRDQAETALAGVQAEQERVGAMRAAAEAERDSAYADIDAEAARLRAERAVRAPALPADLLARYERIRADRGGVGAARLYQRRCEGCHLELAGAQWNTVREAAPEEVLRCEECGRILVRTSESGL